MKINSVRSKAERTQQVHWDALRENLPQCWLAPALPCTVSQLSKNTVSKAMMTQQSMKCRLLFTVYKARGVCVWKLDREHCKCSRNVTSWGKMGTNVLIKISVLKNSTLSFDGSIFIDKKTYCFSSQKEKAAYILLWAWFCNFPWGTEVCMDGECL